MLVSLKTLKRFKSIQKIKRYSKDSKFKKVNFEILWPWFLVFSFEFKTKNSKLKTEFKKFKRTKIKKKSNKKFWLWRPFLFSFFCCGALSFFGGVVAPLSFFFGGCGVLSFFLVVAPPFVAPPHLFFFLLWRHPFPFFFGCGALPFFFFFWLWRPLLFFFWLWRLLLFFFLVVAFFFLFKFF